MSALELRTTRGDRMVIKSKHAGSNCHDALHRKAEEVSAGEYERWGRAPVRPLAPFNLRIAHALLMEEFATADDQDTMGSDTQPWIDPSRIAPDFFDPHVGRMKNGCFISY